MPITEELDLTRAATKILLLESVHPAAVTALEQSGFPQVERIEGAMERSTLIEKIRDVQMIGIRSRTKLTPEVLAEARRLMAIGCFCIGTNQVALDLAAERGIPVFNAPHSSTRSVAELVIGLTVMLMRKTFTKSMAAHRNEWKKTAAGAFEVRGKTLGVVGYGHIGSQVSILAEAMGMQVVFYDIQSKLPLGNAQAKGSLQEVLGQADVVTLHVPEDETTRLMINEQTIRAIKRGAYLINASRGTVVEIEPLAAALRSGQIAGAAVDVFPTEPKGPGQRFESPLIGLDDVILTPHVGGSTMEAQRNIGLEVAGRLVAFAGRGSTEGAVNFPRVNLPSKERTRRILHIHHNIPGVLGRINEAIASNEINVLGQYLATDAKIGYVVLDIEKGAGFSQPLLEVIERVEGTIRVRVVY